MMVICIKSQSHGNNHFSEFPVGSPFSSTHPDKSHPVDRCPMCISFRSFCFLRHQVKTANKCLEIMQNVLLAYAGRVLEVVTSILNINL